MPALLLEHPVAAERGGAREIGAGRHVGAGERRQVLDESLAGAAAGDIAAVQQDVGVGAEGAPPRGDAVGLLVERALVKHAVAQLQLTRGAVREDVHRAEIAAPGQRLADLFDAVAR